MHSHVRKLLFNTVYIPSYQEYKLGFLKILRNTWLQYKSNYQIRISQTNDVAYLGYILSQEHVVVEDKLDCKKASVSVTQREELVRESKCSEHFRPVAALGGGGGWMLDTAST